MSFTDSISFVPGLFIPGNDKDIILAKNTYTEIEYCFKATENIKSDTYYFWLNSTKAVILDNQNIPSLNVNIPDVSDNVNQNLSKKIISVYPNPINDKVKVHFDQDFTGAVATILDSSGRTFTTQKAFWEELTINVETMLAGLYYLQIEFENKKSIFKIVK